MKAVAAIAVLCIAQNYALKLEKAPAWEDPNRPNYGSGPCEACGYDGGASLDLQKQTAKAGVVGASTKIQCDQFHSNCNSCCAGDPSYKGKCKFDSGDVACQNACQFQKDACYKNADQWKSLAQLRGAKKKAPAWEDPNRPNYGSGPCEACGYDGGATLDQQKETAKAGVVGASTEIQCAQFKSNCDACCDGNPSYKGKCKADSGDVACKNSCQFQQDSCNKNAKQWSLMQKKAPAWEDPNRPNYGSGPCEACGYDGGASLDLQKQTAKAGVVGASTAIQCDQYFSNCNACCDGNPSYKGKCKADSGDVACKNSCQFQKEACNGNSDQWASR